jgi:hypothetical protein
MLQVLNFAFLTTRFHLRAIIELWICMAIQYPALPSTVRTHNSSRISRMGFANSCECSSTSQSFLKDIASACRKTQFTSYSILRLFCLSVPLQFVAAYCAALGFIFMLAGQFAQVLVCSIRRIPFLPSQWQFKALHSSGRLLSNALFIPVLYLVFSGFNCGNSVSATCSS